jgi:ADP-heptose:LPS heptosyltransferase
MQIVPRDIKNILALRNDRFGEFLLNIPALRALKETFVNARIIVVVDPYVGELARSISFIDEIIEWGRGRHSLSEKLRLIGFLRKRGINVAIMLNPSKDFNIFAYLAGIPIRVGYDRKWGFLLTHKIQDKKYLGHQHEIEYNLELVSLIGAQTQDKNLSLKIGNNINNNLLGEFNIRDDSRLVALHPWTSDPLKQWPLSNFCELARRLIKELNAKIVIIGGEEEFKVSVELFNHFDSNLINTTGRTTLKQLAGLLKKSKLLISGDSGPMHLACAVGTPVVAIFRNDLPEKSAKRWGPTGANNVVIESESLADIGVDEVINRVKEAIKYK